jgi:hypothetical protein
MASVSITDLKTSAEIGAISIPLRIDVDPANTIASVPVTVGIPCPRGAIQDPVVAVVHSSVCDIDVVQTEPLVRWSDGSLQWLLADFLMPAGAADTPNWTMELSPGGCGRPHRSSLRLCGDVDHYTVTTGTHVVSVPRHELTPFTSVRTGENGPFRPVIGSIVLTDRHGQTVRPTLDRWQVDSQGPVRITMTASGHFRGIRGLRLKLRESFFSETGLMRLDVMLHNARRAKHPGGLWDLGDPGSALFEDLSLYISLGGLPECNVACRTGDGTGCERTFAQDFRLYQDSSGGANWNSQNHVNRHGRNPCRMRGYRMQVGDRESAGLRASPTVSVDSGDCSITAAIPEFWQQFPKAISVEGNRLRMALFPREFDDLFELQGGERKTHVIWLQFGDVAAQEGSQNCRTLEWVHHPVRIQAASEWCEACGALPISIAERGTYGQNLQTILDEAANGSRSIPVLREKADEYGWRNHGDVFADHEQLFYRGTEPLVSHYNNQFDMLCGFLTHYLRTGDWHWWEWGDALARHVVDIDIYHTRKDKAAYNGGPFWFTDHYLHARTATHRTYSRHNRGSQTRSYGGGPSPEHNFTTGLLLHYCLTGSRDSREAVVSLADWVMAMEDGQRNIVGVIENGPTGLATSGGTLGRAAGNSINALLDAYVLTQESRYLEFAEVLIRRCIHPHDDVGSRQLLDVERNWSYTVFLRALSNYLERKSEAAQLDSMFQYAQSSLVHYAMWMLEHERPYFDQAEKLEFPTEAWAAQEFRKANVLRLAARHVEEPSRTRLLDRGDELGDRAWADLLRFETRATARAVAIVMIEGLLDCTLRDRASEAQRRFNRSHAPDFGEPSSFVSQRQRVKAASSHPAGLARLVRRLLTPSRWASYLRHSSRHMNGFE